MICVKVYSLFLKLSTFTIVFSQSKESDASKIHLVELLPQYWKGDCQLLEETTNGERTPLQDAPWRPRDMVILCLEFNMAASVLQGHGLIEPMQSMVDQTDVGMAKEERGRMMSTGFQV